MISKAKEDPTPASTYILILFSLSLSPLSFFIPPPFTLLLLPSPLFLILIRYYTLNTFIHDVVETKVLGSLTAKFKKLFKK